MATWKKGYRNKTRKVRLEITAPKGYRFFGGNLGHGECKNRIGGGKAPTVIKLDAPAGYRIRAMSDSPHGVTLTGSGKQQMKARVGKGGLSATIENKCVGDADVDYKVNVRTPSGGNVSCHPKIVNT